MTKKHEVAKPIGRDLFPGGDDRGDADRVRVVLVSAVVIRVGLVVWRDGSAAMTNAAEILAGESIKLRNRRVGDHKTLCPRCSHRRKKKMDPCLSVTIEGGGGVVWRCHNDDCGYTGGWSPPDARRRSPPPPRRPEYAANEPGVGLVGWFEKRGIPAALVSKHKITAVKTWMPAADATVWAIAFPFYRNGEVVNVKYRGVETKCFKQEKDAEKVFYGLDDLEKSPTEIIICEGEIDKLSLEVADCVNVLSVPDGAQGKKTDGDLVDRDDDKAFAYLWNCIEYFDGVTRIVLATDDDPAGDALAEELARRLGRERCYRPSWPKLHDVPRNDPNEVLMMDSAIVLRECIEMAEPWPVQGLYAASSFRNDVLDLHERGMDVGLTTGFVNVDPRYRVRPGDLTIVTGIPGSGKSEFIDAIITNMAELHGWRFAICSFETPPPLHVIKLAEKRAELPFWDGPSPRMSRAKLGEVMSWVEDHFFFVRADEESPDIDWILERAKVAVVRYGVRGLLIDPYNEIEHKRPRWQSETEYVSQLLGKIRRWAQLNGVHVWFVAHPQKLQRLRDGSVPVPSLYDIAGSAHFVNKADVGMVVHRVYDAIEPTTIVYFRKIKYKSIGEVGESHFLYEKKTGRYFSNGP